MAATIDTVEDFTAKMREFAATDMAASLRLCARRVRATDWQGWRDLAAALVAGHGLEGWASQMSEVGLAKDFGHRVDNVFCAEQVAHRLRCWARIIEEAADELASA